MCLGQNPIITHLTGIGSGELGHHGTADIQQPHGCRNMHRRIHVKPLGKDAELGTKVGLKSQRPLKELFWAQLPRFTYPRKISLRRVTTDGR